MPDARRTPPTPYEDPELATARILEHLARHAEVYKFSPDLSGLGDDGALGRVYAVRLVVDDRGRWTITRGPHGRGGLWDAKTKSWASAALAELGAHDFATVAEAAACLPDALAAQILAVQTYVSHRAKMGMLP